MRWPGERDGSRPLLGPKGRLDKTGVERLTSGREATGRGQNTTAVRSHRLRNSESEQIRGRGPGITARWNMPADRCELLPGVQISRGKTI